MEKFLVARDILPTTDVYTNIHGLQQLGKNVDKNEALKKVAQQFESMFINMMLKTMRQANSAFEEGNLFNSSEGEFYRDMHDNQLSLTLAHKKGLGIADLMYQQLRRNYGNSEAEQEFVNETTVPQRAERVAIADSPRAFMDKVMPYISKAAAALGVEAEILVAQAALETGWGKHMLAKANGEASNNLFNIKRDSQWQGETVSVASLEQKNGVMQAEKAEFKSYDNLAASVADYVELIKNKSHFREALDAAGNAFEFIKKLQEGGYATDSAYASKVFAVYQHIKGMDGAQQ